VLADVLAILLSVITITYQGESASLQQAFYASTLQPVFGNEGGSLVYAILFVLLNWAIGYILYKKKIYIKI
jgi:predicted acyltransferase